MLCYREVYNTVSEGALDCASQTYILQSKDLMPPRTHTKEMRRTVEQLVHP